MKRALPKRNASHSNPFLLALVALTSIIVIIITAHFYEHSRLADSTHKLRHIKPALGRHFWAASHWRRQYFSRPRQWHPIKNRLGDWVERSQQFNSASSGTLTNAANSSADIVDDTVVSYSPPLPAHTFHPRAAPSLPLHSVLPPTATPRL